MIPSFRRIDFFTRVFKFDIWINLNVPVTLLIWNLLIDGLSSATHIHQCTWNTRYSIDGFIFCEWMADLSYQVQFNQVHITNHYQWILFTPTQYSPLSRMSLFHKAWTCNKLGYPERDHDRILEKYQIYTANTTHSSRTSLSYITHKLCM